MGAHLKCVVGHYWDGCKCTRCGHTRDEQHPWQGCICARCGAHRNEQHEWETANCRLRCRLCGRAGEENHAWEGCRCTRCAATRHTWLHGRCTRCGLICAHEQTAVSLEERGSQETFHGVVWLVCSSCGERLREIWEK